MLLPRQKATVFALSNHGHGRVGQVGRCQPAFVPANTAELNKYELVTGDILSARSGATALKRANAALTEFGEEEAANLTKRGVAIRASCAEVKQGLQAIAVETLGKARLSRLRRELVQLAAALSKASQP